MTHPFHLDWLRRFREDLRVGDLDSLTQHVELAGLDVLLDPEFLALAAQEDARSVVVLIATLGEANSDEPAPYQRWLAAYQYLQQQLDLSEAAEGCAACGSASAAFYAAVLQAAKQGAPLPSIGTAPCERSPVCAGVVGQHRTQLGHAHPAQSLAGRGPQRHALVARLPRCGGPQPTGACPQRSG